MPTFFGGNFPLSSLIPNNIHSAMARKNPPHRIVQHVKTHNTDWIRARVHSQENLHHSFIPFHFNFYSLFLCCNIRRQPLSGNESSLAISRRWISSSSFNSERCFFIHVPRCVFWGKQIYPVYVLFSFV